MIKSLALFVNALYKSDQQFVALNNDLAKFTNSFTNTDREVANALHDLNQLLTTTRQFIDKNGEVLTHDVNNLADVTNAILQPEPRNGLETALHVFPNLGANLDEHHRRRTPAASWACPSSPTSPTRCSSSAARSRPAAGWATRSPPRLCAQYLAPILDAIKFNFPPFGVNQFTGAMTLPKQIAYSEPRLQPPPGYKDTTVPGIFSRDTLFSHGNHEPGWVAAPGMQGVDVQPFTAEHADPGVARRADGWARRRDAAGAARVRRAAGGNLPGPPDAYSENNPLPPPWYPQPGPPPGPAPGVIPGDPGRFAAAGGLHRPHRQAPAPAGPPLPAEAGGMSMRKWSRIAQPRAWRSLAVALVLTLVRVVARHRERAAAGRPRHRTGQDDDLRADAGYVGAQRQQPRPGGRRVRRPGARDRAEELGRDADAGPATRASSCRRTHSPRSARPACWARQHVRAGLAAGPVAAAAEERRHDPAEELARRSRPPSGCWRASPPSCAAAASRTSRSIQTEVNNMLTGRADQIREFLDRLDTFTDELNQQRDDITRAIDSTNRLLTIVAQRNDTLDRVLTEFPPLIKHFADTRDLFADAVEALGRISEAADDALAPSSANLHTNLQNLQRPLKQLGQASPYLVGALKLMLTAPFTHRERAEGGSRRLHQRVARWST